LSGRLHAERIRRRRLPGIDAEEGGKREEKWSGRRPSGQKGRVKGEGFGRGGRAGDRCVELRREGVPAATKTRSWQAQVVHDASR
jgi:hypothetical protein